MRHQSGRAGAFCMERGVFMYQVSDAFLQAVQENTRRYYLTGEIKTKGGAVYPFSYEDIVKGSGYIAAQCCGSTEMELGTVYSAELGITLLSDIDRYTLEDAEVELFYHLRLADGAYETIPMGVFEVSEANRMVKCLELKAYDYMVRFEKDFSSFQSVGNCYDFMVLCSDACGVGLAQTREEISAFQNAEIRISIYEDNDIETYRDVLYYVGQLLGGFFFINREGRLELKRFGAETVAEVRQEHRYSSSVSDFMTRYTAVSSTNVVTETAEYYHLDPDDGLTMNLGANPFLQYGLEVTREEICMNILDALSAINYTPFDVETTGNPALDIGDVILLSGGQMDVSGTVGCITSRTVRIGGREKLKGVGKNPRLSAAKSKNDKNLTGILNRVDSNTIQMELFTNAKELMLGSSPRLAEQITFAVKKQTTVEFQGQIVVDVTPDNVQKRAPVSLAALIDALGRAGEIEDEFSAEWQESGLAVCDVAFEMDQETVRVHCPAETWTEGRHTLSLYYPIENVAENLVHDFRVYLTVTGGSGKVAVGGAIGCIRGFGLVGADIEWDGTIMVDETMENPVPFHSGMGVGAYEGAVGVDTETPKGIAFGEAFGSIAMGGFSAEMTDG